MVRGLSRASTSAEFILEIELLRGNNKLQQSVVLRVEGFRTCSMCELN